MRQVHLSKMFERISKLTRAAVSTVRTYWPRDPAVRFGASHVGIGMLTAALMIGAGLTIPGGRALGLLGLVFGLASIALGLWPRASRDLATSQMTSTFGLAAFTAALCALTGGLESPFLIWLMVAPVEAVLSGRRRNLAICATISGVGFVTLAALYFGGGLAPSLLPANLTPVITGLAVASALGAVMLSLSDVLGRMRRQEKMFDANLRGARTLSDDAPDMILQLGSDGCIVQANEAARRLLDLDPNEVRGLTPGVLVHIADYHLLHTALSDVYATHHSITAQFRVRRRDGAFVWAEMTARTNGKGGVVAVFRDMTARKAAEQALIDSARAAVEQSKSKSRFLANMSHELRTPLNAIIGFSDMIRQEVFGPVGHSRYREYASHIHSSGQHLVDLISDLLDMSKIEAGKFRLSLKPVEIVPLVDESIEMVKLQAEEAGVSLTALLPSNLPAPMADRRALKQIMLNLLSNAIKFTPAQGRVVVGARRQDRELVLEVRDTGVGIPEADLARIGKPFEQAEMDLMRTQKGTGLGLSLVAALAGLHGGRMQLDSAPGDGTTVTVYLPIDPKEQAPDDTIIYPERFRVGGGKG